MTAPIFDRPPATRPPATRRRLSLLVVGAVAAADPSRILTGPRESLAAHLAVFAAEQARLNGTVVTVPGS